ncbi:MAG: ribokinase [Pirellula sp.]
MQSLSQPARIAVCGSINQDLVVRIEHLPQPGETRIANTLHEISGGKGANQAVALARLGTPVAMLGRVGSDGFATSLMENLRREGIELHGVETVPGPSGVAVVAVEDSGQNAIMVVPGANGTWTPTDIDRHRGLIAQSDWLVLQLEIPLDAVERAIVLAKRHGRRVLLNPAPAPKALPDSMLDVDVFCPNQSEAELLLGRSIPSVDAACEAAHELLKKGPKMVVITLGSQGSVAADTTGVYTIPAFPVVACDTTAAGDAFIGALVSQLADGAPLESACRFASAAAAHSVTRPGAQPSLPTRADVDAILARFSQTA